MYDVVIVGGGAVGCAAAHHLTREPGLRIAMIERDPTYAICSTARSAGGVRQQFSTPENIALSQATLTLLASLQDTFGIGADVSFRRQGYLILASANGRDVLANNLVIQRAAGANIHWVEGEDLASRFPWINPNGVSAASFGAGGEGWIDPVALMTLLRASARSAGCDIIHGNVAAIHHNDHRIEAISLDDGQRITCGALINAAGAWSGALARLADIDLPVEPRKRYVYVIDSRRASEAMRAGPLTVDPSGAWLRPEGRTFICGISPDEASEPSATDLDYIDYAPFEDIVWPALAARIPALEEAKLLSAWAGFYDYNTLDQNAIIGPDTRLSNFYFANGFSGHGLQQAYGAGRAVAELIVHGHFRTLDLTRFGYARIARGEPLFELNVI